jgi:hypothetical protein
MFINHAISAQRQDAIHIAWKKKPESPVFVVFTMC